MIRGKSRFLTGSVILVVMTVLALNFTNVSKSYAAQTPISGGSSSSNSPTSSIPAVCKGGDFFGLVPWYHYLHLTSRDTTPGNDETATCQVCFNVLDTTSTSPECNQGDTHSDIPLVLLAVIDDLLRIAGLVAIGYIFYGATQYTISQGNPDATSKAQQTVINALVGLGIALVTIGVVTFIGTQLTK
jgi:hypothetical protein